MQPKHCMFGKKALLSNFKFKCKVETSEQTQVTVTLHMAWSQPEHWSNCFKALNATPLYELFLGPTLSHVK